MALALQEERPQLYLLPELLVGLLALLLLLLANRLDRPALYDCWLMWKVRWGGEGRRSCTRPQALDILVRLLCALWLLLNVTSAAPAAAFVDAYCKVPLLRRAGLPSPRVLAALLLTSAALAWLFLWQIVYFAQKYLFYRVALEKSALPLAVKQVHPTVLMSE